MEHLDKICEKLNLNELEKVKFLKDLSVQTKIKPAYFGLGAIAIAVLFAIIGYGSTLLFFLVGFLYPAYMSYKAIETKTSDEDDKQWLTYWVVFSFIHVFDPLLNIVLSIIPFTVIIKLAFNIWLLHPKTRGALLIYNRVIRNLLKKYEGHIDSHIEGVKRTVDEAQPMLQNVTKDLKREAINKVIS